MTGVTGVGGGSWVVQAATGRSADDHVCWPFRDRGELAGGGRGSCATTWPGSRICRNAWIVASCR
jgi:hypothetical protein